jgi:hypothetical protein
MYLKVALISFLMFYKAIKNLVIFYAEGLNFH